MKIAIITEKVIMDHTKLSMVYPEIQWEELVWQAEDFLVDGDQIMLVIPLLPGTYMSWQIYIYPHCYASEALSFTHVCTSISSTFGFRSII